LHYLEEAEAQYLEMLRKARPDLAVKVHHTEEKESRPQKKEWHPKPSAPGFGNKGSPNLMRTSTPTKERLLQLNQHRRHQDHSLELVHVN
jgi:hypothetical protein